MFCLPVLRGHFIVCTHGYHHHHCLSDDHGSVRHMNTSWYLNMTTGLGGMMIYGMIIFGDKTNV